MWHPAMAPLQWHPAMAAMAPRPLPQSWSSAPPGIAHYNVTLQWPAMAPRPLHPAMAMWCHVQSAKVVRCPPPLLEVRTPIAIAIWGKTPKKTNKPKKTQKKTMFSKLVWKLLCFFVFLFFLVCLFFCFFCFFLVFWFLMYILFRNICGVYKHI